VAQAFVERHVRAKRPRTAQEVERLLQHDVLPVWRGRRLSTLTKADTHRLLDPLVDRAPVLANRVLSTLKTFGRWAVERGVIERSPFEGVRQPAEEQTRDRTLDDEEIAALMKALRSEGYPLDPLVELLLRLGARRTEIAEMTWKELDIEAGLWTLPKERSKNKQQHVLPLPDIVVGILRGLPRFPASPWVFTYDGAGPVRSFQEPKKRLDRAMAAELGGPVKAWTMHDLRRTAASRMAELQIAPHVVERVLNHRSGTIKGVAAVYNRYDYRVEQLAALEAWSTRLAEIASGVPAATRRPPRSPPSGPKSIT